jgi:pimeloyl-ACP methyl ester carboxylesterase
MSAGADLSIAYDEAGTGSAVIFSHAGITDRRMWRHQFRDLARDHRVVRYDWRGYGESATAVGDFAHHRDLLSLMDALEIEQACLVGCSMGGSHALEAALAAPGRVRALVRISSGLSGHVWPSEMIDAVRTQVNSSVPADRLAVYQRHAANHVLAEDVAAMAQAQARFMVAGPDRDPADV